MTEASGLMLASPVSMPTLSAPKSEHREKNFSLAEQVSRVLYEGIHPRHAMLNLMTRKAKAEHG